MSEAATNPAGMPAVLHQALQNAPEVSQPYSIPPGMTPEAAAARTRELIADKDFGARLIQGGQHSREARELDALQRHAMGQQQPEAAREPTENERALAALGAPPDISGYTDALMNISGPDGGWVRMDENTSKLVTSELLPTARALDLSPADVSGIAMNIGKPISYEATESALRRLWPGDSFEAGLNDFRAALSNQPAARALIESYESLSNNPALISAIVAAYRRRQGRR